METSRKVALYCRVSTHDQVTGMESQVRALKNYCELNKIENYELFMDEGISGTKSSRPALDRMMVAVRQKEISCVVVYSFSRFTRSTTHMLNGLEEMKKAGANFVSLTEKIDTDSPIGKAVFVIISAIAALERDLIAERVRNGMANAKAKGKLIGRKKLRDSDLIRKLLKAGMTYRQVASISRCSHGSVHAERKAMMAEEKVLKEKEIKKLADEAKQSVQAQQDLEIKYPQLKEMREMQGEGMRKDILNPGYLINDIPTFGSD
jgi:DNA invertase Pin-like site-specific DNA recombinase